MFPFWVGGGAEGIPSPLMSEATPLTYGGVLEVGQHDKEQIC